MNTNQRQLSPREQAAKTTFAIFTFLTIVCGIASIYTTAMGLMTVTDDFFIQCGVAMAAGCCASGFWYFVGRHIEYSSGLQLGLYGLLAIPFVAVIFGFSTIWTVITIGGRRAQVTHMTKTIDTAERLASGYWQRGEREANLVPVFESQARQFDSYARTDMGGGLSNLKGRGEVVVNLETTANLFRNVADQIKGNAKLRKDTYDGLKKKLAAARKIAAESDRGSVGDTRLMEENSLKFTKELADINELLATLNSISSRSYVKQINKNLSRLAMVSDPGNQPGQIAAVKRMKDVVATSQQIIAEVVGDDEEVLEQQQAFSMIDAPQAVLRYWREVSYAWSFALGLDFFPILFLFAMAISSRLHRQNQTAY